MAQELPHHTRRYATARPVLNEVPEHMAQESRNAITGSLPSILNEVPEHMAQESGCSATCPASTNFLNEVPEHMAQEFRDTFVGVLVFGDSSMKFLSTWLRNCWCGGGWYDVSPQ